MSDPSEPSGTSDPSGERDPFRALESDPVPIAPRPDFVQALRQRLVHRLGDPPVVDLPDRRPMTTSASTATATAAPDVDPSSSLTTVVTPYLAVSGAAEALRWYAETFGAREEFRVDADDGRIGHAEFTIGAARFMLSDEFPEAGVLGPDTTRGTPVALHLVVDDVDDVFARAVDDGATSLGEPADQPHGSRHGTLVDPFGHRWMLSQPLEQFDLATYAERSEGTGFTVVAADRPRTERARNGGIWAVLWFDDCPAAIRWYVDVLGFEEALVVPDDSDPSVIAHSELRWPEGGIVQLGSTGGHGIITRPPGDGSLYVITDDPHAVHDRMVAAGVEIVLPIEEPHYDEGGATFTVRDPEGNLVSFGSYAGAP